MRTIGYNMIRVGDFTAAERNEYERAATTLRPTSSGLREHDGVRRSERYRIEGSPGHGGRQGALAVHRQPGRDSTRCATKYIVRNWYLDVFMVEGRWDGAFGSSSTGGPVDKKGNSSGLVIRKDSDTVNLGQTFAHEAGHYLGLDHADEEDGCGDTDPASPTISDNFIFSSSLPGQHRHHRMPDQYDAPARPGALDDTLIPAPSPAGGMTMPTTPIPKRKLPVLDPSVADIESEPPQYNEEDIKDPLDRVPRSRFVLADTPADLRMRVERLLQHREAATRRGMG